MKILITTGIFEPESGGPATYTPRIARALQEAGHEVKVITYSDKAKYDFDSDYPFPLVRIIRRGKLSNYLRFFFAVLKESRHFDFIYSLDWLAAGLPVSLASRLLGKRYVLRIGGGYIWEKYLQNGQDPITLKDFYVKGLYKKYKILFNLISFVFRGAQHIIFNSDEQRILFQKYYAISDKKTSTIFNPVPLKIGGVKRTEATREIVFFGRFIAMKNIEAVLRAFKRARLEGFTLLLIGSGPHKEKIISLISELSLEDVVTIIPTMRQQELYERIKNCYYVVVPSWTDISPNQIYEMLSLQIPFLVTQENYLSFHKEIPLMINPSSVDDLAEKMEYLVSDNNYHIFTDDLKKIVYKHTWDDARDEHLAVFNALM